MEYHWFCDLTLPTNCLSQCILGMLTTLGISLDGKAPAVELSFLLGSTSCGWWMVLVCYEKKLLLIGWWLMLVWYERKIVLAGCRTSRTEWKKWGYALPVIPFRKRLSGEFCCALMVSSIDGLYFHLVRTPFFIELFITFHHIPVTFDHNRRQCEVWTVPTRSATGRWPVQ